MSTNDFHEDDEFISPRSKVEIVKSIEDICREPGYIYSICFIIMQDMFYVDGNITGVDWQEKLNIQELSVLIGLLVKHEINIELLPTLESCHEQIGKTYSLFKELHSSYSEPFVKQYKNKYEDIENLEIESNYEQKLKSFFDEEELMAEPIFYGGSGGYDFQYLELALLKYMNDDDWLIANKGISINDIVSIGKGFKDILHKKYESLPTPSTFNELCKNALAFFCFTKDDIVLGNQKSVNSFLECFSLKPGDVNDLFSIFGDYNAVESHPIIKVTNNTYFLPIHFLLTQSIYESPFYWMGSDANYKDKAFKNRGDAAEEVAFNLLTTVFGAENVHKNVSVHKNKNDLLTDIDVLAIAGNKALIIQAKSKKLTTFSKKGNNKTLKKDFKEAVQKAYMQGLTSRKAILNNKSSLVDGKGKPLNLGEYIDDAYIICITIDHYHAIASQVNTYLDKSPNDPYPLAISILDLDTLTFYLNDPYELLYYVRQRINLVSFVKASSEMAYLGFHLKRKLFLPKQDATVILIDDYFAKLVDANFPVVKSDSPKTGDFEDLYSTWKNEKFDTLITRVKNTKNPGFTDAIFFLYDLTGDAADDFVEAMEKTINWTKRDGKRHDFSMIFESGKSGATFLSYPEYIPECDVTLISLSMGRKYLTKADRWLGIVCTVNTVNLFHAIIFNKEPWVEDENMQEIANIALKKGVPMYLNGKKPSKNAVCYCGSGKKFKRCHGKGM